MDRQYPDLHRNFTLGVLNGAFFMAALAFITGSSVLPLFISKMTSSKVLIGIFSHIEWFGWLFPQLFAAIFLAHKRKVLYFYNGLSALRLFLFGLSVASIFLFKDDFAMILAAFGVTFTLFSLSSGTAGVTFMEIVVKAIPLNKRGSFFGSRMFSGGLLAALGGLAVKKIISAYQFPYDFGYVCVISWILMFLGLASFAMVREPESSEGMEKASPASQFKTAMRILRSESNFRRLVYSKAWVNTALMASPFYVIFALENLKAPEWMAGIYLTSGMIGYLISNLLWGWLSNRVSNKMVIVLAGIFRMIPAAAAFAFCFFPIDPYIFAVVFFLMGMAESGIDLGYMTYLLEISPERGRILTIGLLHTLMAPTVFFSGIGGWLSQILSLKWLFLVVMLTMSVSLAISGGLKEPRVRSS